MADPTIQTFCCHHSNDSDMGVRIMQEFNTNAYNTVCIASSSIGLIGALYQLIGRSVPSLQILPREERGHSQRWMSITATRGRKIIIWLAVADLLASLGVLIRSSLWFNFKNIMPGRDDTSSVVFCAISSAWTQYFYMATWLWTLCYAIDMRLVLKEREGYPKYYHLVSWIIPAVLTTLGLSLLYYPDANCHGYQSITSALTRVLPNYLATYIPILTIMVMNPILYMSSTEDMEVVVHRSLGQITNKERDIMDTIKFKFSLINLAFIVCWMPNIINGILLWTLWWHLPVKVIITVWYIMAVTNPLQALFNCIVYRRWSRGSEKIVIPWKDMYREAQDKMSSLSLPSSKVASAREDLPLLQSVPRNSINVYSSFG